MVLWVPRGGSPMSFKARLAQDAGQTMAEYGLVLTMITVAVVIAIAALSGGITGAIDSVTSIMP